LGQGQDKKLEKARREKARNIKDSWTSPDQKCEKIIDPIYLSCTFKPCSSPSRQRTTSFYAESMNLEQTG
jgi:hypothetical protein